MKQRKPELTCHSFQDLKTLVETKSYSFPDPKPKPKDDGIEQGPELDEKLFKEAMEGVRPVSGVGYVERSFEMSLPEGTRIQEDAEALARLRALITHGAGFNVSATPEYIEGTGYNVGRGITERLHRGDFSIQAHVDLHGLTAEAAKEVFEAFLKQAVTMGKKGVLIVHGRGLSSPSEPVLKKKVVEWLTRGVWRKWVIAYCSARVCDGGAGATYVLLRHRPVSKRMKMRKGRA
jgi:DNA-nicking Smr family endonuclease